MMRRVRHNDQTRQCELRRGVVTLELIVIMPILFFTFLAIFEFGFLGLTLQTGHTALIEGARRGAELYPPNYPLDLAGPDNDIADQVVERMNQYLNIQCLEIYDPTQGLVDDPEHANVHVIIERGVNLPIERGDSMPVGFMCTPHGAPPTSTEIRVTVCFPIVDATDPHGCGNPVPDWLDIVGFSLLGCNFEVSSRMPLE
jgi:hypothetical protein